MKKVTRTLMLLALTVALIVTGVSVGTAQSQSDLTLCFAFQDLETEFWVAGHRAITTSLREQGIEVIEYNGNEDPNRQLEQVRDCIAQGVDGIIIIPQDGDSADTIVAEAQDSDVPIAVFNRPPNNRERGLVVVADNLTITEQAVEYMAQLALAKYEVTGESLTPMVIVGALQDTNAIFRRDGFYNVIARYSERYPDLFNEPIEVASEWDPPTLLANLEAAITNNPDVDFLFTSSDFLFPTIRSVLEPRGMWVPSGEQGHVIMGGLDGDATACQLIKDGYVESTGVQDLFVEADATVNALLEAIEAGEFAPNEVIDDPGFALTSANIQFREMDMWGCVLLAEGFLDQ